MGVRGELQMLETAIRRRWAVDTEKAARTVNKYLDHPDPRIAVRVASIAVMMEGQNQKDEHKLVDVEIQQQHARLDVVAAELGIDQSTIEATCREAIVGDSGIEVEAR